MLLPEPALMFIKAETDIQETTLPEAAEALAGSEALAQMR